MNILTASNQLFEYFLKNDLLLLDDFNKFFFLLEDVEINKEVVHLACKQMEEHGVIKGFNLDGKEYFSLVKPLHFYEQAISLSGNTCNRIASLLNEIYDEDVCNVMNIEEKHINEILNILIHKIENNEEPAE